MNTAPAPGDLTGDGPLLPRLLRLAGPIVLMMYLQNAYNIIDTVWVGRLLGESSLAGIAVGGYVLWGMFGLAQLVAVGLAAVVARRIGAGERAEAERAVSRGLWFALAASVVFGAAVWFALEPLFDLMGAAGPMRAEGLLYMRVLLLGAPLVFLSFAIQNAMQAAGDAVTPMWLMALSLLVNTALDPVLMLGLGGLPRLGIAGAALATVVARLVWVLLGLALLFSGRRLTLGRRGLPALGVGALRACLRRDCFWDWPSLGVVVRVGLPTAVSQVLFPAVYMLLVRIPAQYGDHQVAALRIGHTVEGMSFFLAIGCSLAVGALVGQNLGAGKPDRAARAAWTGAGLVAAVLLLFSVAFYFLAEPIAALFSPQPATVAASAVYLRILAWSQVFMGIEIALGGAFNGAGDTLPPTLVVVPLNLVRIPLAYVLASGLGWGVAGVWWAISGSSIVKGLLLAGLFASGGWARRRL